MGDRWVDPSVTRFLGGILSVPTDQRSGRRRLCQIYVICMEKL